MSYNVTPTSHPARTKIWLPSPHESVRVKYEQTEDGRLFYEAYGSPAALIAAGVMEESILLPMSGCRRRTPDSRGICWRTVIRGPNQAKWKIDCRVSVEVARRLPGVPSDLLRHELARWAECPWQPAQARGR